MLQNKNLPNKLFIELVQMLSQALRLHGIEDSRLYRTHNPKHICCLWCASSRAHFRWAYEHACELHNMYRHFIQKKPGPHASLRVLKVIESFLPILPTSMPETIDADEFYDCIKYIRSKQSASARKTAGDVLCSYTNLPDNCTCIALAINAEYQSECVRYDKDGRIDGIATYRAYHNQKHPLMPESGPAWQEAELLDRYLATDHSTVTP